MPDVMFTGPEGRLEGRYHQSKEEHAPIALILHPHPQYGGTMNHKVVFAASAAARAGSTTAWAS
jgi:alpha/beta superfamily hydrolase